MSIQGPVFAPLHRDEFYTIIGERYNAARAEAEAVGARIQIEMRVEFFKPVHFNWTNYKLKTGDTQVTLETNCAWFPYGIINRDPCFDYIKFWTGAKTIYIGDWFVMPVYNFQEKQGAYKGNLKHYEFRSGETFDFYVHCTTTPMPSEVDAWILGFIVCPRTMAELKIIR